MLSASSRLPEQYCNVQPPTVTDVQNAQNILPEEQDQTFLQASLSEPAVDLCTEYHTQDAVLLFFSVLETSMGLLSQLHLSSLPVLRYRAYRLYLVQVRPKVECQGSSPAMLHAAVSPALER